MVVYFGVSSFASAVSKLKKTIQGGMTICHLRYLQNPLKAD
jgi:hypothetical protein